MVGNTHVSITWACLLGDSRSQRVHSLTYILIRFLIAEAPVPRPSSSSPPRLGPPIFFFSHPPTPVPFSTPHITFAYAHLHILLSGRGGSMEGVHPPSPSSFAPRRSRPTVDFFCAPRRLPARNLLANCANIRKMNVVSVPSFLVRFFVAFSGGNPFS